MDQKRSSISRSKIGANVFLQVVLFFLLFGIVNYLGFQHYKRWDFSRDQKYSLSSQTRRVVSNLKKPTHLIVFFSGGSDIAQDVTSLLKEYAFASKKMIDVEVVDPFMAMARAREVATQYKLRDNDNVVIIDYDGRSKFVNAASMAEYEPSFSPVDKPRLKAFKGEEALTSALIEISEENVNKIHTLLGHGETALDSDPSLDGLKSYIERQNIKIEPLKLSDVEAVPPDTKTLFIIAPKYDFSDTELLALRSYWEKRGRIWIFLNPGSDTPKLSAFLADLGITVHGDQVMRTMPLKLASGMVTGILKEITGDFVPGSPITKRLGNVTASFQGGATQSLGLDAERVKASDIKLKPLIQASKGFWGEARYATAASSGVFFDPREDHINPVVAASAEKGGISEDRVRVDSSRLIVIGNASFITNSVLTEADLDFVLSGINWLLAREELIGIAPKPVRNLALSLTQAQISSIALWVMIAIPAFPIVFGTLVWLKRRR
jgi:ABC-type uncharacterized transport system involved in gliding motility auxiliary subunit